jgi:NAD(P)-dependent dehydrogenase (short-subunit alcohol dehydrogenase family)
VGTRVGLNSDQAFPALYFVGVWALVNNAGALGQSGVDDWLEVDDFRFTLEVNVLGVIRCTHAFLPLLKLQQGRVVIMGSMVGR